MGAIAGSTIAALFYANPDRIAFGELVSVLATSLLHSANGAVDIHTAHHDLVIFDLADSRICLALRDLAPTCSEPAPRRDRGAAVIVSVGARPDAHAAGLDHLEVCERLSQRIETRVPADGTILAESDLAFTAESLDAAVEDLLVAYWGGGAPDTETAPVADDAPTVQPDAAATTPMRRDAVAVPATPQPTPPRSRRAGVLDPIRPTELSGGLAARFDREMAAREAARNAPRAYAPVRHSPGPTLFPSTTYGEPRPLPPPRGTRAMSVFSRLRRQPEPEQDALFPKPEVARAQPLVHRGAIHGLNAAMLAFSLPMGAFLLTLALLGRESLAMSARMSAVTGAGIGLAQNDSVTSFVLGLV